MSSRLRSAFGLVLLSLAAAVVAGSSRFASAQEEKPPYDETQMAEEQKEEQEAREMISNIRSLVLPQQKERAQEMIDKYPNTRVAKLAEQLLEEFRLYDALAAAESARIEARTASVREYWTSRYPGGSFEGEPTRITNLSGEPALYQVRGPSMDWSGPHVLRVGETHLLKYAAEYRRITLEGTEEYALRVGGNYVFRQPDGGGGPRLFTARN